MKFTKSTVAALTAPAGKDDHIVWDPELPGFGIRFRGGARSWVCQYRHGHQQRRETLGTLLKVDLDTARKIARQRFAQVELGVDPAAEKAQARAEAAASAPKLTLAIAAERYLDFKRHQLRPASYEAARRYFAVHWAPLATRPIESIRRADVAARLQEIAKAHGRVSASRARANLSALLAWAMGEALIESNVVIGTNNPAPPSSRERVLDPGEIKVIWNACEDDDFGAIVRLLLLTGQRRNEIADLRWSEVDFDAAAITLPPGRTKNARLHVVPLSGAALSILKARPRLPAERDLIFGRGDRGYTGWTNAKAKLDRNIAAAGKPLALWTLHDLRRTCATGMADIDVDPHVVEAVLNHASGSKRGVAGVYNRSRYEPQKRMALDRWAERVSAIVEGRREKVVALRA